MEQNTQFHFYPIYQTLITGRHYGSIACNGTFINVQSGIEVPFYAQGLSWAYFVFMSLKTELQTHLYGTYRLQGK